MTPKAKLAFGGVLAIAIGALVALALVINSATGDSSSLGSGSEDPTPAPSDGGTDAAPQPSEAATSADGFVDLDNAAPGAQEAAAAFLTAYTTDPGTKGWIKNLEPVATPEMVASIATSNPEIATSLASAHVGEPSNGNVPVAVDGQTVARLTLVQIPPTPEDEITQDTPWTVQAIDLYTVTEGALPLSSNSQRTIATDIQPSLAALVVQPAGLTDEARLEQIKASFTEPDAALEVPRLGTEEERIEMGNVHDVQLTASADGDLIATAVVPWVIADGNSQAEWSSYSIRLTRTEDGSWTAADVFPQ